MANVRTDLLNNIRDEKYYSEIELIRLANDPVMKYREKIRALSQILGTIAVVNSKMELATAYFQEAPAEDTDEQSENGTQKDGTSTEETDSTPTTGVTVEEGTDNVVEEPKAKTQGQSHSE